MRMPPRAEFQEYLELVSQQEPYDESNYLEGGGLVRELLNNHRFRDMLINAGHCFSHQDGVNMAFLSLFITGFQMGRHFEGRFKENLDLQALRAEIDSAAPLRSSGQGMIIR